MKRIKIKGYKPFDGCPKCGSYDYESILDGPDYFDYKDEQYASVLHITTCSDCGHRYTFKEIFKYCCDIIKE